MARVAVLDIELAGARRLADSVRGAGFDPVTADNLDDFARAGAAVGVIAFEALWPEPQRALEQLRAHYGRSRLVVVYRDGAPRLQLGRRLWSIGLCDQFVSRSLAPHELRPILRQAWADSLTQGDRDDAGPIRALSTLAAGLAGQRDIKGLVRELFVRLPELIDYAVCELLVVGDAPTLYVSQTELVDDEQLWALAREVCAAAAPLTEVALVPERLTWDSASVVMPRPRTRTPGHALTLACPMVVGGQLVGCLGIRLSPGAASEADARTMVQIVASQLSACLRYAQLLAEATTQALTDELTGAHNRRYLQRVLDHEWRRANRYGFPLAIAIIDIDHFKRVNDVHGHLVGDQILANLSAVIRNQLRDSDHVVRYGGEEFLLLLPQTGGTDALLVVERLRALVASTMQITISAGVATSGTGATSPEHLVELADQALYESKHGGRNAVTLSNTPAVNVAPALPRPVAARREPRALVLCDDPATRLQVQRVLRAVQCEAAIVDSDDSPLLAPDQLARCNLFVIGESKLRQSIGQALRDLQRDPEVRIVVINEHGDRRAALDTIHSERVEHLVPGAFADEALFATLTKLIMGDYFGIKKYLMWGATTNTWQLDTHADKPRVLDGITRLARQVNCHPRIVDQLVQAVDEMLINALFRSARGGASQRPVTVELGSDGRLLAVSVSDEHGMLDSRDIFDGIGAALESQVRGVPADAAHARLGFRIMLDALSQLSVNVDPGRCTEIIGIVDLRRSLREHRAAVPGLGVFRVDS
jgi:diguanylate cyclase (GGDEF)-like protein